MSTRYLLLGRLRFVASTARAAAAEPGRVGDPAPARRLGAVPGFAFAMALSAAFPPGRE
ncbi:MAG TPA: hypothetical protein VD867_11950 [Burkholderiales bacterium]|nr:hypothetical protein [Burkholderiales bacterium]